MSNPTPLTNGQIVNGAMFNEPMRVETVRQSGPASWVAGLVGLRSERFRNVTLTATDLADLTIQDNKSTFDGDGQLLRLGLQAYSLGIAYDLTRISVFPFRALIRCRTNSKPFTIIY